MKTDNLTATETTAAEGAQAQENDEAAAAVGKFRDVQTLLKAYTNLEAEFTRRSQRLKELERGSKTEEKPDAAQIPPSRNEDEELLCAVRANGRVRDKVISEYLKNVSEGGAVPLVTGGGGIAAPRANPKSVKDAGKLAQEFLKG